MHFAGDCLVRQSTFTTPTLSSLLLAAQASLICVCVCVGSSMLLHKQQKLISRYAAAVPIIPTWHHSLNYSASPLFLQLSCSHTPTATVYNGTFVATVFFVILMQMNTLHQKYVVHKVASAQICATDFDFSLSHCTLCPFQN